MPNCAFYPQLDIWSVSSLLLRPTKSTAGAVGGVGTSPEKPLEDFPPLHPDFRREAGGRT